MFNYLFSQINRYFTRLLTLWFLAVSAIIMFIIILVDMSEYSRKALTSSKIYFNDLLQLGILRLPHHYQMVLPFVVFIAAMVTFSRLTRNQESTVSRGFGISIWQMAAGLNGFVGGISVVYLLILNPLAALCNQQHEKLEQKIFAGKDISVTLFEEGLWLRENYKDRQSIITVERVKGDEKKFLNIQMQNFTPNFLFQSRIDAKEGMIRNGCWELKEVTVYNAQKPSENFPLLELTTDLTFEKILSSDRDPHFLSFWRLPDFISLMEKSGLSTLPYRMYWHSLLAKVGFMASLVFLAAAFTQRPVRQGHTFLLVLLALGTGLVLHFFSDIVTAQGKIGRLPILVAAWAPSFIVMLLSTSLILHIEEG